MAANTLHVLVFLLGIVTFASSQDILCYTCSPNNNSSSCGEPENNNVSVTTCTADILITNGTAICFSTYLQYTGLRENETGIYRGCNTLRPDVGDFCDWFSEENKSQNLTIPSCVSCNSTRCNTARFNADGTSGASSMSTITFVMAVTTIVVMIFS